ncbi:hypothetical protein [Amphibacillus cookii]|uniref:hypothetical protein n=1 Tax=Amphibacillus cookii TaxID=767787 RepID=UPI0019566B7B|nr:hypothetical protein [Amphibacillus cookii]MBM7539763.1 hypothetical protein [Amphibacillus cookii]
MDRYGAHYQRLSVLLKAYQHQYQRRLNLETRYPYLKFNYSEVVDALLITPTVLFIIDPQANRKFISIKSRLPSTLNVPIHPLSDPFCDIASIAHHYQTVYLSPTELRYIKQIFTQKNSCNRIISTYHVPDTAIKKGVWCPNCRTVMLTYQQQAWSCPNCHHYYPHAYVNTLREFAILYGPHLSLSQLYQCLGLPSEQSIVPLIREAKLPYITKANQPIYCLNRLFRKDQY